MRMLPKRFRVAVTTTFTPGRPIRLTFNSAMIFEFSADEARTLALALADAIEVVEQRGSGG